MLDKAYILRYNNCQIRKVPGLTFQGACGDCEQAGGTWENWADCWYEF